MDIKKLILLVLLTFTLASCSRVPSPNELSKKVPDSINSSTKNPKLIALCITSKWEDSSNIFGNAIVTSRELENGFRVSMYLPAGGLYFMADIKKTKTGSQTKTWTREMIKSFVKDEFDTVVMCQI